MKQRLMDVHIFFKSNSTPMIIYQAKMTFEGGIEAEAEDVKERKAKGETLEFTAIDRNSGEEMAVLVDSTEIVGVSVVEVGILDESGVPF